MTTTGPPALRRHRPTTATGQRRRNLLAAAVAALAAAIALTSVLGPLVLGLMRYRTSPTTLNQLLGSDAAALFVVAPLAVVAAVLVLRRQTAGVLLASGVGVFALYTYAQLVIGQEYLRLPGNVERFFPLLLTVFLLAEATLVLAGGRCLRTRRRCHGGWNVSPLARCSRWRSSWYWASICARCSWPGPTPCR
jgi:uncharacterized Tic20 family protein